MIEGESVDAVALLSAQHRDLDESFSLYFIGTPQSNPQVLVQRILAGLKVHMALEEEIFYPAYLAATGQADRHRDSTAEHESARSLISWIENTDPSDSLYGAMIRALWKTMSRHIAEEESPDGMFNSQWLSPPESLALGERLASRGVELRQLLDAHAAWPQQSDR